MTDAEDFPTIAKRKKAAKQAIGRLNATPQQPRTATNAATQAGYGAAAIRKAVERIEASTTRNIDVNAELFNLGQLIAAGVLERTTVETAIAAAGTRAGLPEREIRKLLRSEGGIAAGMAKPRDMSNVGTLTGAPGYTPPPSPPPVRLDFDTLENGFWASRKSLQDIYIAALSRMCAPWSVLACCAARALALVRPHIVLPGLIGGAGSLNWFGAITATSGGGKGAASATAKNLVNDPVQQRNSGSGEGMISAYRRAAVGDEPAGMHESIMFMVDEIDALTAQSKRNGATTMSVLRSAFSGETLGFSYVNKNTPTIEAHTYRMTMIISAQPSRAADLIDDYHGGTPQRFMWFPGVDRRITTELAGGYVESLTLPKPGVWQYPMTIQIPAVASEFILRERVKVMQGAGNALDGHALFMREKFAFALAVLDGRSSVTVEDWELSGIAAQVSDSTRDWVVALAKEAQVDEATERGKLQGVSALAADEEKDYRTDEKWNRITALVLKHLNAAIDFGLTRRDMARKLGRDGKWATSILAQLETEGKARYDKDENRYHITD